MSSLPSFPDITAQIEGHDLRLVVGGADRFAAILEVVSAARSSLRLFFYIFEDDTAGRRLQDALIAAARRGVAVTLLVDGFGSEDAHDSAFAAMKAAGVHFDRFIPRWGRRYLLRNHQKMLIADEGVAVIGGSNIASIYFADDSAGQSWHDLLLRIEGPAAARLARYYDGLAKWVGADRPRIRGLVSLLARHSEATGPIRWKMGGPFRRLSPLTRSLKRDIERAQQVDMIQAYFTPNYGFLRRLARVAERGVCRIMTAARSDNVTTISAARHCYRRLLKGGTQIYEYRPEMLHAKLMVVDDAVWIGSANFDMRSLYINTEICLRIEDAGFAGQMRALFDAHVPHCTAITPASHRADSPWRARAVRLLSYFIVSTVDFRLARRLNIRRRGG